MGKSYKLIIPRYANTLMCLRIFFSSFLLLALVYYDITQLFAKYPLLPIFSYFITTLISILHLLISIIYLFCQKEIDNWFIHAIFEVSFVYNLFSILISIIVEFMYWISNEYIQFYGIPSFLFISIHLIPLMFHILELSYNNFWPKYDNIKLTLVLVYIYEQFYFFVTNYWKGVFTYPFLLINLESIYPAILSLFLGEAVFGIFHYFFIIAFLKFCPLFLKRK